jgi:cyclopropane fatty-acyl-phospholipid synthase-like methyltransferase
MILALSGLLAACNSGAGQRERASDVAAFPQADRPKSSPAAEDLASEAKREQAGEAHAMLQQADIRAGMTVADIGAGDGYYTVRLAQKVGPNGRVLAEDVDDEALRRLGDRVAREHLDNVSIRHGADADPKLPEGSFDRIVLAHVYREVREPYAFLWNLRPALRAGGRSRPVYRPARHCAHTVVLRNDRSRLSAYGISSHAGGKRLLCRV